MANLRIPDEFGIVSENARRREFYAKFIKPAVEAYIVSPSGQARITREVEARLKEEIDAIVARRTQERIAEIAKLNTPSGPPIKEVLLLVSDVTGQDLPELVGPRRSRNVAWPRFLAVHILVHVRPDLSLPAIGHALGGRDHTTIMHARDKMQRLKTEEPFVRWLADERVVAMMALRPQLAQAA